MGYSSRQLLDYPTNTPRVFHVEMTWQQPFPRRFNLESMRYVCRVANVEIKPASYIRCVERHCKYNMDCMILFISSQIFLS